MEASILCTEIRGWSAPVEYLNHSLSLIVRLRCLHSMYALIIEANVQGLFLIHPLPAFPKISPILFSSVANYSPDHLPTYSGFITFSSIATHHVLLPETRFFPAIYTASFFLFIILKYRGDVLEC